jgi:hypothetical protein
MLQVENSIEKMLKSTGDAEAAITAALIKNLKNVGVSLVIRLK